MRPRCAHCVHSCVRYNPRSGGWRRLWCGHEEVETWAPLEACWRFDRREEPPADEEVAQ